MNRCPPRHRCLRASALMLACLLAGAAVPARATAADPAAAAPDGLADLSLDALLDMPVSGVSRFVQRRSQASSSVTVISRAEILALGHRTLADVLATVRGTMPSTDRTYQYLGVRGAFMPGDYNTRVLVLIDGNRVNDAIYDQGFLGSEFPLDLANVERVEFVAGQGSAVYGANALFGVVNVITREPARRSEATGSLALGSEGERIARVGLRVAMAGGGLQIFGSQARRAGGDVLDPARAAAGLDAWSRGADGERRDALHLRYDRGDFAASLVHSDRTKGLPLMLDRVFGDPVNTYRDTYTLLNLEYGRALDPDLRLTTRGYLGAYRFVGRYDVDYPPVTQNRDYALTQWRGLETRLTATGVAGHRLVGGLEWTDAPVLTQANDDLAPQAMNYLRDERRAWRVALYGEDQWALNDAWTVHLGLRADRVQDTQTQVSPRLAAIWQPYPHWTLKAIHGQAFRPPNTYEAHYRTDFAGGYLPNPDLHAERVRGNELVAEWQPQAAWRVSGSLYRNHSDGLLQLDYDSGIDRYRFGNTGVLDSQGLELEVEHVADRLRWRANFSHSVSRAGTGSADPGFYPSDMLKGTAVLPLAADWTLGLEANATSRHGPVPGQASANLTLRGPLLALPGLAAAAGPGASRGPVLSLSVRNLADRTLFDVGADAQRQPVVPLPGRSWRLTLDWTIEP